MNILTEWEQQSPLESPPAYVWKNPGRVIDRHGRSIITTGDVWILHDPARDIQINWKLLNTAAEVKDAAKAYVAHTIESQAPGAAWTVFNHLKYVLQELLTLSSLADLTYQRLEGALVELRHTGSAWKFGHVRRWYRWCCNLGITGFDKEIAERLERHKIPTNTTGEAVMTRDPERGPLDDQEHWLLRQAVKHEKGSVLDRACIMLPLELGLRPSQAVLLDEQDLKIIRAESGHEFFSLDVIRLKQGIAGKPAKKRRRISPELGYVLQQLIEENHRLYGHGGPETAILRSSTYKPLSGDSGAHNSQQSGHVRRMTRLVFTYRVCKYARKAAIISPRTGKVLNLFPYRLRYTFGTRHANQGTPAAVLAEMLDQSCMVSVRVYTKSTNSMVERLNTALGTNDQFTDVIERFLGEIKIRTGSEDPHSIIYGTVPTLKNLGGIGSCGAKFLCKLMPPLSCYICPKFQAWTDAPHEQILRELEGYVQTLIERSGNPSDRIPHQLTETITAIRALLAKLGRGKKEGRE